MSRRAAIFLAGVAVIAALVFLPLRLALALVDLPVTARQASGTIWSGRIADTRLAGRPLGTLDVGLEMLPLLTGQLSLAVTRIDAQAPPFSGRIGTGLGGRFARDLSGALPGGMIGDLPVESITLDAVTIRFSGDACAEAAGRVRIMLATEIAGVTLRNGMAGSVRCDGDMLLPLTGDSGAERLMLRVSGDGSYAATLSAGGSANLLRFRGQL